MQPTWTTRTTWTTWTTDLSLNPSPKERDLYVCLLKPLFLNECLLCAGIKAPLPRRGVGVRSH